MLVAVIIGGSLAAAAGVVWMTRRWPLPGRGALLRVHLLLAAGLVAATVAWPTASTVRSAVESAPNVLLVSIDTARGDAFGFHGGGTAATGRTPVTPHLDALARNGTVFARAFAQDNWTLPSHASIFTSLYPPSHGVENLDSVLDDRHRTLAELLQDAGYRTGAFVDTDREGFVGAARGFDHGFEDYLHYPDARGPAQIFLPARLWADFAIFFEAGHADGLVDSAIHWIDVGRARRDRNSGGDGDQRQPFFLFLHLYDVHASWGSRWPLHRLPYFAHSPFYEEAMGAPAPPRDHFVFEGRSGARYLAAANRRLRRGASADTLLPGDGLAQLRALYDSGISFVDEELGRLAEHLAEAGILDHTVLIVTSDHGEAFLEHGEFLHEQEYGETLHVPLLFHWPGAIAAGQVLQSTAELIDIAPTVLSLAGLAPAPEMQGRNLRSQMSPRARAVDDGNWVARPSFHANRVDGIYGVRTQEFSYLLRKWGRSEDDRYGSAWRGQDSPGAETNDGTRSGFREELYDLIQDPAEATNVRDVRPILLSRARALLLPFIAAQESTARAHGDGSRAPMSQRTLELLKSLGYIDD